MSGNIKVAIVRSVAGLQSQMECEFETTKMLKKRIEMDDKFKHVSYEIVTWDEGDTDWSRFTHIVLSSGIDYSHCVKEFLAWLDSVPQNKVYNSPSMIRWNLNKIYLLELREKGIKVPPTVFMEKCNPPHTNCVMFELKRDTDRPINCLVVKEIVDAGGLTSRRLYLDTPDELPREVLTEILASSETGVIIQPFLENILKEGEWSAIYFGRKLSHFVLKTPTGSEFRIQSRFGGEKKIVELKEVPADMMELAQEVVDIIPQEERLLYVRVDMVRDNEGQPCLMELEAFEPDLYLNQVQFAENYLNALLELS